jgi:hypothetical protein
VCVPLKCASAPALIFSSYFPVLWFFTTSNIFRSCFETFWRSSFFACFLPWSRSTSCPSGSMRLSGLLRTYV